MHGNRDPQLWARGSGKVLSSATSAIGIAQMRTEAQKGPRAVHLDLNRGPGDLELKLTTISNTTGEAGQFPPQFPHNALKMQTVY